MSQCCKMIGRRMNPLRGFLLNLFVLPMAATLSIIISSASCVSAQTVTVSVTPHRVNVGDTVSIKIETGSAEKPDAVILVPDKGVLPLDLSQSGTGVYLSRFIVKTGDPQGLYAIEASVGGKTGQAAIGKATFLYKKIMGDFCITGVFDPKNPEEDMNNYLQQIKGFGGNFLIVHPVITSKKVYYKSKICNMDSSSAVDQSYLGTLLNCADRNGIPVMISASWDMTRDIYPPERMKSTKQIMEELYSLYGSHPSVVGFYMYQEGSGIYYAPFVREFCGYVKSINPGLLTACAPYVDNPLLAGYLSAIKNLDIIIYQGMVMASYRPDSRLKFPFGRVKDFGSLGSGASELQNKILLTHVETFGYRENALENLYITKYNNIYQQMLSAATVPANDGIVMFTYSAVNYNLTRQHPEFASEFAHSREAVYDGMKAFKLIGSASEDRNQLAVYLPWTDFHVFRWERYYYKAFDAFRVMGIPVDVLPYAPTDAESYPPYYPSHENPQALERLLKEKEVIVLPSISGVNRPDSDLLKHFVEDGGTVIAFGPKIPGGSTYERSDLFGMDKVGTRGTHTELILHEAFSGKFRKNSKWSLGTVTLPIWKAKGGKVLAKFDDGSPAIVVNSYGKGKAVSLLTDMTTAAERFPNLVRELLDELGVQRYVDILGTTENCDVAVSKTVVGFTAAIVNHGNTKLEIKLKPLVSLSPKASREWIDLVSSEKIAKSKGMEPLKITVMPGSYRLIEMREQHGK